VVLFIAFYGPLPTGKIFNIGIPNYVYKFRIAVAITPLLYVVHEAVDRYFGNELAQKMEMEAHQLPTS
jgi:uncharacterized PurR-regulated membrane protein YhhQ (DUF165 family)